MRIWIIGRSYPSPKNNMQGSFELEQAKMLAKRGHEVTYVAIVFHPYKKIRKWGFVTWQEDNLRICAFSCVYAPVRMYIHLEWFRNLIIRHALIQTERIAGRPDVIHLHYPALLGGAKILNEYHLKQISIVCTEHWSRVHEKTIDRVQLDNLKAYVTLADAFICVGDSLRESVIQLTGTSRMIDVVPNVVSPLFKPIDKKHRRESFTFITVGRLVPIKQYDKVIEAFSIVYQKQKNVRLVMIGEGNQHANLEKEIEKLKIKEVVSLMGVMPLSDVAKNVAEADCLICYSKSETFGVPVIEAWASGIPVIVADSLGFSKNWDDNLGTIVDCKDSMQLAKKMEWMTNRSDYYRSDYLVSYVAQHYSESAVMKQLDEIYWTIRKEIID